MKRNIKVQRKPHHNFSTSSSSSSSPFNFFLYFFLLFFLSLLHDKQHFQTPPTETWQSYVQDGDKEERRWEGGRKEETHAHTKRAKGFELLQSYNFAFPSFPSAKEKEELSKKEREILNLIK